MNINGKETDFILYGITPPKFSDDKEKIRSIAATQLDRIKTLKLDALILYDIQDESSRIDVERPFPFMQTIAPEEYAYQYLSGLNTPKIIYQSVGKFTPESFQAWLVKNSKTINHMVFVGSPSKMLATSLPLNDAYKLVRDLNLSLQVGGVTIPERHYKKGDEHIRVLHKVDKGCSFFISQCVYSINLAKDFVSDYYYTSIEEGKKVAPIIFTLTPCGSLKTLNFLEWLGIEIPRWLKNDLKYSNNILAHSVEHCKMIASELYVYCKERNIPVGFNIESVAIKKDEIDASIQLLKDIKKMMGLV